MRTAAVPAIHRSADPLLCVPFRLRRAMRQAWLVMESAGSDSIPLLSLSRGGPAVYGGYDAVVVSGAPVPGALGAVFTARGVAGVVNATSATVPVGVATHVAMTAGTGGERCVFHNGIVVGCSADSPTATTAFVEGVTVRAGLPGLSL